MTLRVSPSLALALVACGGGTATTTPAMTAMTISPAAMVDGGTTATPAGDAGASLATVGRAFAPDSPNLMTYEDAIAAADEPGPGTPLTDAELGAPMHNAKFISGCGAPSEMKVKVRVAVRDGHAYAVSVYATPENPAVAQCVAGAVRKLRWPSTPHRDFFTVTY